MQLETVSGTIKYPSCAVTVQQKMCLFLMRMVLLAGIAERNVVLEENPETYFTVSAVSQKTIRILFRTNITYLTCCEEFVDASVKNDIINCVK